MVARDDTLIPPAFRLERLRAYGAGEAPPLPRSIQAPAIEDDEEDETAEQEDEEIEAAPSRPAIAEAAAEQEGDDERGHRRRRRRRRRGDEPREGRAAPAETAPEAAEPAKPSEAPAREPREAAEDERDGDDRRRRRRGRRGGRVRGRREEGAETPVRQVAAETVEIVPPSEEQRGVEETGAAPNLEPWPGDAGYEAASLAPFAGDGNEPAHTAEPAHAAAPAHAATPEREHEREAPAAPTAESEGGVPFVSETERVLEEATAAPANSADGQASDAPPSSEPAIPSEDVLTVTEKPANPRRGWWQRLVQP
jgi:ribonuclease E